MVDMIEHESSVSLDSIATRATGSLQVLTGGTDFDRTFLIKKMEVELTVYPGIDFAAAPTFAAPVPGKLVFFHSGGIASSIADAFDAALTDKERSNDVIWTLPFVWQPMVHDTDAVGDIIPGQGVALARTKSFPKGYPMDKDEVYSWTVFNPGSFAFPNPDSNSECILRVRYWGVYL